MLTLQKNEWNDVYIFFVRRNVRKLTCHTAKFREEAIENYFEKSLGELWYMMNIPVLEQ